MKQRQIEVLPFRNDHLVLITHPSSSAREKDGARSRCKDLAAQKFIGFDPDIPTRKAVDQIFRSTSSRSSR